MTLSLILVCLWVLIAAVIEALPQRLHWRGAAVLIALGIPLLGFVTLEKGPLWGLAVLVVGMSVLRWPLIRLGQWLRQRLR